MPKNQQTCLKSASFWLLVLFWLSTRSINIYNQDDYYTSNTRFVLHFYNSWPKFKWMKARVLYYSNSTATFNILVCGDIHPHPGPEHLSSRSNTNTNSTNRLVLHCYYQNVRSIKSGFKLKEFKNVVYSNKFDIVAILTEHE